MNLSIVIIGLGGIGSILSEKICQFLHYYKNGLSNDENFAKEMGITPPIFDDIIVTLVDGDSYEIRNRQRQDFSQIGQKAEIKERDLREKYGLLTYQSVNEYITENNINGIIKENDIVFICVDNHKSRKIINNHCKTLNNISVFSGGNGFHLANSQRYIRKNGVDIRPNLTKFHPEIENSGNDHPNDLGCQALAQAEPQLVFANFGAAFSMAISFYSEVILGKDTGISDSFVDVINGQMLSKKYPI
jgi:hypothetical protein